MSVATACGFEASTRNCNKPIMAAQAARTADRECCAKSRTADMTSTADCPLPLGHLHALSRTRTPQEQGRPRIAEGSSAPQPDNLRADRRKAPWSIHIPDTKVRSANGKGILGKSPLLPAHANRDKPAHRLPLPQADIQPSSSARLVSCARTTGASIASLSHHSDIDAP